jgi:hypothetical protein
MLINMFAMFSCQQLNKLETTSQRPIYPKLFFVSTRNSAVLMKLTKPVEHKISNHLYSIQGIELFENGSEIRNHDLIHSRRSLVLVNNSIDFKASCKNAILPIRSNSMYAV